MQLKQVQEANIYVYTYVRETRVYDISCTFPFTHPLTPHLSQNKMGEGGEGPIRICIKYFHIEEGERI